MKRNNRVVMALQSLCLTFIVVIQFTITKITIPNLTYMPFLVMTLLLSLVIIVLELAKEYKD